MTGIRIHTLFSRLGPWPRLLSTRLRKYLPQLRNAGSEGSITKR